MSEPAVAAFPPGIPHPGSTLRRNDVVRIFGTPDETVGSVNEPRIRTENGLSYNEKWTYNRPRHEPSRPRARVLYWNRYDLVGSLRIEQDGHIVRESEHELRARESE